MSRVDLHVHTTASDGKLSPAEIVKEAQRLGVEYLGICDHDSIESIAPAQESAKNYPGMTVIGGVEINTDTAEGELHMLGYLCDCQNVQLKLALEQLNQSRLERARKMTERLNNLGLNINYDRVKEIAGKGSVGRPHIAQALLEQGYISTLKEAFDKYISRGGPAYIERDKITPIDAIHIILKSGGIPVLAHPLTYGKPEDLISSLKPEGLRGVEVYYGNYSPNQVKTLINLASKYQLIATGGSDFHGLGEVGESPLGSVKVPLECATQLLSLARQR